MTPQAPAVPGKAAAVAAQAAVDAKRLEGSIDVNIGLSDDRRARVKAATSSNPVIQFNDLSRGVALGAQ